MRGAASVLAPLSRHPATSLYPEHVLGMPPSSTGPAAAGIAREMLLRRRPNATQLLASCENVAAPPFFASCLEDLRHRLQFAQGECSDTVIVSVGFYDTSAVTPPAKVPPSRCHVLLVDQATYGNTSGSSLNGWRVVRTPLCFVSPHDAQRSAHFIKTSLPLLLPNTQRILYGDIKCRGPERLYPSRELLGALQPGVDVVAVTHGVHHASYTLAEEFEGTVSHLRQRNERLEAFEDIDAYRAWLRRVQPGYGMSTPGLIPDTLCLAWANTAAARSFACRWSSEVALFSMREQLSFDHSRPANLTL
eukprot:7364734-Prymnesium_polylepis.1